MPKALFRSFLRLEDARRMRDALIASGIPESALTLRSLGDEAGAVSGNFTVGNGLPPGPSRDSDGYERNFAKPSAGATNLLVVQAQDEVQREHAETMLLGDLHLPSVTPPTPTP